MNFFTAEKKTLRPRVIKTKNNRPKSAPQPLNNHDLFEAKVVLDSQFVTKYLSERSNDSKEKQQENQDDLVQNISIISIRSDDADDSVVFVAEEEANREARKIAKLNQAIMHLKGYSKRLEIHVQALQSKILTQNTNAQNLDGESNEVVEIIDDVAVPENIVIAQGMNIEPVPENNLIAPAREIQQAIENEDVLFNMHIDQDWIQSQIDDILNDPNHSKFTEEIAALLGEDLQN